MNNDGRNYTEITIMPQPTARCANCGFPLTEQQYFCPRCGAAQWGMSRCANCGVMLQPGQQFCPRCGHPAGAAAASYTPATITSTMKKKNKMPLTLLIVLLIAALVGIAGITLGPIIFMDTAGYIEKGNLEKAWNKAKNDEDRNLVLEAYLAKGNYKEAYEKALTKEDKLAIKFENAAAVQSAAAIDSLKNPASFTLRDAYYYEDNDDDENSIYLVLEIGGMNGFGGVVSNYWLYTWDQEDEDWGYYCSVYDLEEDEYSKYDDSGETLEKFIDNLGRIYIRESIREGSQLSDDAIDRINKMFEQDKLDKVELLDIPMLQSNNG